MEELRKASLEELEKLMKDSEFNREENLYWKEMEKRRDSLFEEDDYEGKAEFYIQQLALMRGKFRERVFVERKLKYLVGHAYEGLGTEVLKGASPKKRAEMFEIASAWYRAADETLGFLTADCSLREAICYDNAIPFRRAARLEEEKTKEFEQKRDRIMARIFGTTEVMMIAPTKEDIGKLLDGVDEKQKENKGA